LQHQLAALAVQAHRLVADLAHQEHRLARRLVQRHGQLVLGPGRFNGLAHLALRPEEAVCRCGVVDALVWAEMVVMVDEVGQPLLGFQQFLWFNTGPEFFAHRAPEALALAQGLRVMRPRHHVLDPLLRQQLLELALAAPGEILAPLVAQ
jgi:hypothetical protein